MATFTLHKDVLKTCPYDPNHKIATRKWILHILECEKKLGSNFSVCVYNQSHRMPRHEFASHLKSCPDSRQFIRETDDYARQLEANQSQPTLTPTSQSETNCVPIDDISDTNDGEDNWDNDNFGHFSIYDHSQPSIASNTQTNVANNSQKLTKNQKKRMRRKANQTQQQTTESQCKSIWD